MKATREIYIKELKLAGNGERAVADKRYHKSQREHWGVSAPACDKVLRALCQDLSDDEILSIAKELWETNLFDPMICAARMISLPKIKPSQDLWKTVCAFLRLVDGWALEDCMMRAAWKCILENESLLDEMDAWTKHPNFWMRRAALVYTLPYAKPRRDPERMLQWASHYAPDPEWFIQKAIGWWLRVLGEHNPQRVVEFLKPHWHILKGVARKEATRKLPQWTIIDK